MHSLSHCFNPESSSVPLDNPPLSLSVMSAPSSSCLSIHPRINSHSLFLSLWCFFAFRPHPSHICLPNNFHVLLLFSFIALSLPLSLLRLPAGLVSLALVLGGDSSLESLIKHLQTSALGHTHTRMQTHMDSRRTLHTNTHGQQRGHCARTHRCTFRQMHSD